MMVDEKRVIEAYHGIVLLVRLATELGHTLARGWPAIQPHKAHRRQTTNPSVS